jgi:hypothetical protein
MKCSEIEKEYVKKKGLKLFVKIYEKPSKMRKSF